MEALEEEETQFYAAKLQAVVRKFVIRSRIMKDITQRYEKIFDPKRKKYYYYDRKLDSSSWLKPVLLLDKDIEDVAPTYLPEQAAVKLQRVVRRFLSLLKVRLKFQECIVKVKDEKSNDEYFINSKTGSKLQQLPSFMNGRLDYERKEVREMPGLDSDGESEDESDAESQDTEARLAKRRKKRKYPRSKAQSLVDYVEDNMATAYTLDMSNLQAKHITSRIYDFTQLTDLNLSHNRLAKVSPDLQYLLKLKVLDISHNRIHTLPSELKDLTCLQTLKASHNLIDTFSGHVYRIDTMTYLDLSHNLLVDLPVETGNLEMLTELGLFEVGISQLSSLTYLNLAHNKLATFPAQVSSLSKLKTLLLSHNSIPSMPEDEVDQMSSLQFLDIQHNSLTSLPATLFLLPLKECYANNNAIEDFPALPVSEDASNPSPSPLPLSSLTNLDLSHNKIVSIPAHLNQLTRLQHLTIAHNKLASMDDNSFTNLSSLVKLTLAYNSLTVLPGSLSSCHALEKMLVEHNKLSDLPLGMMRCGRITHLIAHHNNFSSLNGKVLTMFMNLEEIDFHVNALSTFPALLFSVHKVKIADFSYNRIVDLSGQVSEWPDLYKLDLSYNKLTTVPSSLCSCSKLEELYLHYNSLHSLPKELPSLSVLRTLTLHHNQLTTSPTLNVRVGKLLHVDLSSNPLIQSPFAIWQFYHEEEEKSARTNKNSRYHLYRRMMYLEDRVDSHLERSKHGIGMSEEGKDFVPPVVDIVKRMYDDLNPSPSHRHKAFAQLKHAFIQLEEGLNAYGSAHGDVGTGRAPPSSVPAPQELCARLLRFFQFWYVLQEERRVLSIQHKIRLNLTPPSPHLPTRYPNPFLRSAKEVETLLTEVHGGWGGKESRSLEKILSLLPLRGELWTELNDAMKICADMNRHTSLLHILTLLPSPASNAANANNDISLLLQGKEEGVRGVWESDDQAGVGTRDSNKEKGVVRVESTKTDKSSAGGGLLGSLFKKKATPVVPTTPAVDTSAKADENKDMDNAYNESLDGLKEGHVKEGQEMLDKVMALLSNPTLSLPLHLLLVPPPQKPARSASSLFPTPLPPFSLPSPVLSLPLPPTLLPDYEDAVGGGVGFPPLVLKLYVCMLKLLLALSDGLAEGVRVIERAIAEREECQGYASKLDVAQRGFIHPIMPSATSDAVEVAATPDIFDLFGDLWTLLGGDIEGSGKEKNKGDKKIGERVKKYRSEFEEVFRGLLPPDPDAEGTESATEGASPHSSAPGTPTRASRPSNPPSPLPVLTTPTASVMAHSASDFSTISSDNNTIAPLLAPAPFPAVMSLLDLLLILRQLLLLYAVHIGSVVMEVLGGVGEGVGGEGSLDALLLPSQPPLDIGLPLPPPQPALNLLSPPLVRMIRRWGTRVYVYMGGIWKGLGVYPLSAIYYRSHIQLMNKVTEGAGGTLGGVRVSKDVYVWLVKVLLAQGQYFQARSICEYIAVTYLVSPQNPNTAPSLPAAAKNGTSSAIPTPAQLLSIDTEVSLLFKFAVIQCEELVKVGVFSSTQKRIYDVQTSGFLCSRSSSLLPEVIPADQGGVGRSRAFGEELGRRRLAEESDREASKRDRDRQGILEQSTKLRNEAQKMLDWVAKINVK